MIRIEKEEYKFSHGHYPRGRGWWLFDLKGNLFDAGPLKTFTEAKKTAVAKAKELGVSEVKVLP